ncbi:3-methyladenine DNA glycosidase [Plasmopara halstedii]|uniref:3-methyladenine DNA glycosidase n=1 Tax=Plasmopara halstedii TaxID=4781 RepID=A0A0P1A908_PLAHL|nr:3-methyladenine DNA glycosidase [Plasmopara halstedii]CEG36821.1 3-methyladenine DNA glycosidase [Plasmopara halstedii]|eukprot:XP_024573190.1 3-methyladenine DNA glycosidase [Plasmopara halstedii]
MSGDSEKMMELSAWRDAVSFGAYLQPIQLQVDQTKSIRADSCNGEAVPFQSTQNSCISSIDHTENSTIGTSVTQQLTENSMPLQDTQSATEQNDEMSNVTIIAPFTCEELNNGEQMALNVGGPVWAMDWLPSKPAANATATANNLIRKNQKRPQRIHEIDQNAAVKGKENNKTDIPASTVANKTAELETNLISDWRYLALATHPPCVVEDGKVVKSTPPDHYYDAPESGRNLIQIWAVPVQRPSTSSTSKKSLKIAKPRLVYAIDHDSGVAWDLQWCPLVKKFPKSHCLENILGILAVCFSDGSMRVYKIPVISNEQLTREHIVEKERLVDRCHPIVVASLPRIMQLSVQWSPHSWQMLLTGGSDGSVSLWNIKSAVIASDSSSDDSLKGEPIEPLRRFQDADTIGKQEAFDWGCGWVAIRAVSWSPFDEHLFATTGNDSVFKVWDVREPRVCLRSHRIRSTWGLALQWMDQTSIQISGDQGSVYAYDILSGSYQKLHFHPQIDSPVWDLQFARRNATPLLISACTSGSIRAAPAKRQYRVPHNCVEICRLSGEKDSNIEKPFKTLRVSFDKTSVLGSADSVSQNTREFCERDASLHRLRISSVTPGDVPCLLAAGGHAGLVILFEIQEVLDTLSSSFYTPTIRRTGQSRKKMISAAENKNAKKNLSGAPATVEDVERKTKTLGSLLKAEEMPTAMSKYKKKSHGISKGIARRHANAKKKSFIQDDEDVEVKNDIIDEDGPDFEEIDEDDDESDMSLVIEDNSDDDRVSISDGIIEEEHEEANGPEDAEQNRLIREYQLDLSEEDALLLAIQMSKEPIEETQQATATTEAPARMTSKKETASRNKRTRMEGAMEKCQSSETMLRGRRTTNRKGDVLKTVEDMGIFETKQPAGALANSDVSSGLDEEAALGINAHPNTDTFQQAGQERSDECMNKETESDQNVIDPTRRVAFSLGEGEKLTERLIRSTRKAEGATKKRRNIEKAPRGVRQRRIAQGNTSPRKSQPTKESGRETQLGYSEMNENEPSSLFSMGSKYLDNTPVAIDDIKKKAAVSRSKRAPVLQVTRGNNRKNLTATPDKQISTDLDEEKQPAYAEIFKNTHLTQNSKRGAQAKMVRKKTQKAASTRRDIRSKYRKDDTATDNAPANYLSKDSAAYPACDDALPARRTTGTDAMAVSAARKGKKTATTIRQRRTSINVKKNMSKKDAIQFAIKVVQDSGCDEELSNQSKHSVAASRVASESIESENTGKRVFSSSSSEKVVTKKRQKTTTTSRERRKRFSRDDTASGEVVATKTAKDDAGDKQTIDTAASTTSSSETKTAKGSGHIATMELQKTKKITARSRVRRRKRDGCMMSEEDALLLALAISELEY